MKKRILIILFCELCFGLFFVLSAQFTSDEIEEREKWEKFLKTAEIVEEKQLGSGDMATAPWRLSLEKDGKSRGALWKNPEGSLNGFDESWKWEIASYLLDKYLGLNMVPPTVEREFHGERGCCQLWVTAEMDLRRKEREGIETPPDQVYSWNKALYLQRAFDNLVANIDRHKGNVLVTKDWRMILIDFSRSFRTSEKFTTDLIYTENHQEGPRIMRRLPQSFVEKLKNLNLELMKEIAGRYLTEEEIESVLSRKGLILNEIARLIEKYGEDDVLY